VAGLEFYFGETGERTWGHSGMKEKGGALGSDKEKHPYETSMEI